MQFCPNAKMATEKNQAYGSFAKSFFQSKFGKEMICVYNETFNLMNCTVNKFLFYVVVI